MHIPEDIERQEGKESDNVQIKLKRHLLIGLSLINAIGDSFRSIAIVV